MIKKQFKNSASLLDRIFPVGTRSVLFGVHAFWWHPITVYIAWVALYKKLPSFWETVAIMVHDIGYWGKKAMDDPDGEMHPVFGAKLIQKLRFFFFGNHKQSNDLAMLVAFHSRYLAARWNREPSALCWPDKLSLRFDPMWFYLLRARLSGELREYRLNAAHAVPLTQSNRSWFKWIRAKCSLVAYNKTPGSIRNSTVSDFSKTA